MSTPQTVVYEPCADGHRLGYVRRAVEALGPCQVIVVTRPQVLATPEWRTHLGDLDLDVRTFDGPAQTARPRIALGYCRQLLRLCRQESADLLVLDGDWVVLPWCAARVLSGDRRRRRETFLIMRPPVPPGGLSRRTLLAAVKRRLYVLASAAFTNVSLLMLTAPWEDGHGVPGRWPAAADPMPPSAELVLQKAEARRRLGLPADATLLLCAGSLTERKHVRALLDSISTMPPDVVVCLVGRPDEEVRLSIETSAAQRHRATGRLVLLTDYVTDLTLDTYVAAADVLAVLYRNEEGSSGLVGKALLSQTPMLAWGNRAAVQAVQRSKLGRVTPPEEIGRVMQTRFWSVLPSEDAERLRALLLGSCSRFASTIVASRGVPR